MVSVSKKMGKFCLFLVKIARVVLSPWMKSVISTSTFTLALCITWKHQKYLERSVRCFTTAFG